MIFITSIFKEKLFSLVGYDTDLTDENLVNLEREIESYPE